MEVRQVQGERGAKSGVAGLQKLRKVTNSNPCGALQRRTEDASVVR